MFLLEEAAAAQGAGGMWSMLAIYGVFIVVLYFILIRPQRKRQKATDAMQKAISNGDWVLMSGGIYGKVVSTVNECLMIEFGTNKSVIVPVRRDQILAVQEPDLSQHTMDAAGEEPKDALVEGDDLREDGLDDYDMYLIEKGEKKAKKSRFKKKD